jgi:hypothetical protein
MTAPPSSIDATVTIEVGALYEQLAGIPHRETVEAAVDNAWAAQRDRVITDVIAAVEETHTFGALPEPGEPEPAPEQDDGDAKAKDRPRGSSGKSSSAKGGSSKKR